MDMKNMSDKEFIQCLYKGTFSSYDFKVGSKVTTEKILDIGYRGVKIVDGFIRITRPMIESAENNEVLEIIDTDDTDYIYLLSNNLWYHEDFLTPSK